jgi:diguanylate cyclase (GGDEF)-like protein
MCIAIIFAAVYTFPLEILDLKLLVFVIVTVFFSSKLQIQIPRTKMHFTVSDALLFVAIILYGYQTAVILSFLDCLYGCFSLKIKSKQTLAINVSVATTTIFGTSFLTVLIFPELAEVGINGDLSKLVGILFVIAIIQFFLNSIFISITYSLKHNQPLWSVWKDYYFNCLMMYFASSVIAGLVIKSIAQIDFILLFISIAVASVIYMTYKNYVEDIKKTTAQAEISEHERAESEKLRAEQAEKHIRELERFIAEQDKSSQALRESKEKFRHAAFHDSLTDLPNRSYFSQEVKFMLEKTKIMPGFCFAVLFLDMNRFKNVNDSLGHSMGDRLIVNVAKRLKTIVRKGDMVSRFSGDEFAILLNNIRDNEEVSRYAEMIQKKISTPFTISGKQIFTSVSIGIAVSLSDYEDSQDILRDADIAMYRAKEKGESYKIYDPKMHSQTVKLLQLETDLRYAVAREEFCVYYQPIIDLNSMKLKGFEALVRWNHPERGLIAPYEFIPVCEETGMIIPMTIWILRTACLQVKKWQQSSVENRNLMISVNLSGKHFAQLDLVEQIWAILSETDFNPQYLKLEITESAVMENAESAISILKELKELGIQLSIDDFGTGYSSLSYLHRFPIDTLKIDRSFVNSMTEGAENGEFVQTIITLAHTLGLGVIAEGIETINQLHQLRILDCEYGQGYLFSRPVPENEIEILLLDQNVWKSYATPQQEQIPQMPNEVPKLRLA